MRYIDLDKIQFFMGVDAETGEEMMLATMNQIEELPTADVVEVRHGEWLEQYEGSRLLKCSVCGYEFCDLIECGNFCGNCGAKMDGERREK